RPCAGIHLLLDQRVKSKALREIAPGRVLSFDEFDLPLPVPSLERFFAPDGRVHRVVHLEPHETLHTISLGETTGRLFAVLPNAAVQLRRDARVKRSVKAARKQIHARDAFHSAESK